jgi:hypothetical protein
VRVPAIGAQQHSGPKEDNQKVDPRDQKQGPEKQTDNEEGADGQQMAAGAFDLSWPLVAAMWAVDFWFCEW